MDAIVHTGGSLKWAMDADLVPTNINGLMNVIALARKNGASVHYLRWGVMEGLWWCVVG